MPVRVNANLYDLFVMNEFGNKEGQLVGHVMRTKSGHYKTRILGKPIDGANFLTKAKALIEAERIYNAE